MSDFPASPFGHEINCDEIVSVMQGFSGWEDRYRQVILWGKQLPVMPEALKSAQITVAAAKAKFGS